MSIVKSFFIPRIPFYLTKEMMRQWFSQFGQVCRVDFVSFNNDNGVGRRAYVHYNYYYENTEFNKSFVNNGHVDISIDPTTTLRILENKRPIPQTTLNLDQVANNTIFIGDQVKDQTAKIEALESRITQLENIILSLTQGAAGTAAVATANATTTAIVEDDSLYSDI